MKIKSSRCLPPKKTKTSQRISDHRGWRHRAEKEDVTNCLGTDLFNSCCWWKKPILESSTFFLLKVEKMMFYMDEMMCNGIIWYDCSQNQNDTSTLVCSWREKSWQCYTMWISMIFRLHFHCWIMLNSRCRTSWSFHSEEWDRMGIWSSQWLLATCFSPLLHSWAAVVSWKTLLPP